ncbi:LysR family transcriptional regulator [Lacrimispora indolis]|uniref:LysR family transcriptional regulator n=1 Tax=Lacrimispora indolis TaxID=69825 RepID=UPI00045E6786|nr:LysR family transcriptional regulator [Lacrimispora indolis]MBE7719849.1 LysR family transcriptional regulator [Lacrimispora celerecrescens]
MELRVLRYFLTVVREKNITGAAKALNVTQPTLSKQLMELEESLGKKLFVRGNRTITLTEEGMLLYRRAQEIIDLADKTESEFRGSDEVISGDICIGGAETDAMRLTAKTIKKLQNEYPHIQYHLFSGNADDVTERLDKGLLDFGILIEPADIKKYDYLRLPATDTWGLLMKKDSPLAALEMIRPENLRNIPLLCSKQTLVKNEISGWLRDDYDKLNIVATYNLIYNASLMVEEGVGYALCLDKLVNTTGSSSLCFRPLEPGLEANLDIVWKKYQVFSKAAEKFLEKLQEEINAVS